MADLVNYTPPPHMDAKALIQRAAAQLRAWHDVYGKHNPAWLPPAGDVRWLEDADAYLAAHQWEQPAFVAGPGFPVSGVSTWRTGPTGALVRVCEISDVECSRGCNVGPCAKRNAGVDVPDKVQLPEKARAGIEVLRDVVEKLLTTSRYVDEEGEATLALADMAACIADPPFRLAGTSGPALGEGGTHDR